MWRCQDASGRAPHGDLLSSPIVPWPAMMPTSSYPFTYTMPRSIPISAAASRASNRCPPAWMTSAPYDRQLFTLVSGAISGMTTVTGTSERGPWNASARAWLPAEAAITPALRCASSSWAMTLAPPRSLKEPVTCSYSFLVNSSMPKSSERRFERLQVVWTCGVCQG